MVGENHTPFPAMLLTTCIDEEGMYASMIARATFDLGERGELELAKTQTWRVSPEPWESPLGAFDPDQPFRKGGVDLFVAGEACAPDAKPAKEVSLEVKVGEHVARALAVGERVWLKPGIGRPPLASEPKAFVTMPIGIGRAYGGETEIDGMTVPYPLNDKGLGFHATEELALGKPLPTLEDPDHRIRFWDDRPEPVGFGLLPATSGLRVRRAVSVKDNRVERFESVMFNQAFPRMIAAKVSPGDRVSLTGFTHEATLDFPDPGSAARRAPHAREEDGRARSGD